MSISSLVLELWPFSFMRYWPEIQKLEIPPSEFCPISEDWGKLGMLNLAWMSLIKFYWTQQNARVAAFTISALLRVNELLSTTKTSYYKNHGKKLNDPTIQTKFYWTILKSFYNNKKVPLIPPLLLNDKFVTDIKRKANAFKTFFAEQCTPLKKDSNYSTCPNTIKTALNWLQFWRNIKNNKIAWLK